MTKEMAAYGGQGLYRAKGTLSPPQRATGPCRPWAGRQALFFARDLVANLKKKITLRACRPMGAGLSPYGGRPGDIFEIFQNGHIFLKFLFLKNIKKKKPRGRARGGSRVLGRRGPE